MQKKKAKEEKEKAEQEAKEKGDAIPDERMTDDKGEDHSADQAVKDPEKASIKVKRNAEPDPDPDPNPEPDPESELMKESSGLEHLRRRKLGHIA